jgi:hypothetical protein
MRVNERQPQEEAMSQKLMCTHAFAVGCLLLMPATTLAQRAESPWRDTRAAGGQRSEPLLEQARRLSTPPVPARDLEQRAGNGQPQARPERRTPRQRILGAIVGGVGGFFAGGYTGAWIEGDRCHCDDAGLKGAVIGSSVGAAVGGVLGGLYLF